MFGTNEPGVFIALFNWKDKELGVSIVYIYIQKYKWSINSRYKI